MVWVNTQIQNLRAEGKPLVFVVLVKRETTNPFSKMKIESYYTYVMGDTYPLKDLLKKYGFTWVPARYLWMAEKDVAKQIAEELRNAGAEVMEASRPYPDDFDIIRRRVDELIKRGVMKDVEEIAEEIRQVRGYDDDYLLTIEMQIRYIVNTVRRKYRLNGDFEDVLRKMLEGQVGEEWGWLAKDRLQKLARAYVRLRDMGLTDMSIDMICLIQTTYETLKTGRRR